MSHFSVIGMQEAQQQQPLVSRPTMRRKSSAQNLLSSFKGSTPSGAGAASSTNGLPYASASTPTATGPMGGRDMDAQSLHSDTVAAMGAGSPALGPGTSVEYLRDLVQKRIITLTYIRNIHEGRSHWFHTILMSRAELDHEFNNNAMKKRTFRFAVLGMSLANLLDIQQAPDLLRGLLNTLAEYETEDGDKSKMRLFRSKLKRQTGGGFTEYAVSYTDASDASYLMTPHMPFPLDYHQTLLSLLDVLSEVYNKMLKILGPSPFPHSAQMMGPLGLLSPHPGVSYLFPPENQTVADDGSLWGIANANAGTGGQAGAFMYGGGLSSPPAGWSQSLSDTILKIDGKFKKIITTLLKELDDLARSEIQDELASLDPLLRSGSSVGREPYEFDVM